mmetsp:Transcript_63328/g.151080  ORF Transcript_63328/g.151080 Transcript_63328/m.151080 type:complete len:618 (+) Transcript_63328:99-1952(+)
MKPDMRHQWRLILLALVCAQKAAAIYLPGVAPKQYTQGEQVELKVNKLTSVKTQLPFGYYTLPFCQPEKITLSVENLGEILEGDHIQNSPYIIEGKTNTTCKLLCTQKLTDSAQKKFKSMIDDDYMINWMVDNLPAATKYPTVSHGDNIYIEGFPVGFADKGGKHYINNHVTLWLQYHEDAELFEGFRIVGFEVQPKSLAHKSAEGPARCEGKGKYEMGSGSDITFTYDVHWVYSDLRWVSRYDIYIKMPGGQIHWFAILNSLMIVLFLSGMVAMILLRTLHRDITQYNEVTVEDAAEESGWKLVHAQVFRKPPFFWLLAVSVGSGVQILGMSLVTLIFALQGFLSPAYRGGILQSMMFLYTVMGCVAGYTSARLTKLFEDASGRMISLMTAVLYPGLFFSIFFVLNALIWGQKSSGAVDFVTMFMLLVLWFGISVPLVLLGFRVGIRKEAIELPCKVSNLPREIPEQVWYTHPAFMCLIGGLLSFSAVFTELFFIMSSLWQHYFYYLFSFLALVLVIVIIMCAEVSIALTYFQLTSGDYNWWWQSFFASGTSAFYVFMYSILYFSSRLHIEKLVSTMLYFGYMFIISVMFFLLTGAIGFVSTFFFVKAIYSSVKIE